MSTLNESKRREDALNVVLRRVMWGEDEQRILKSLRAKEFSEDEAFAIYREAQQKRTKAIRAIYRPRIFWGLLFIALGCGLFWALWILTEGFAVSSSRALVLPAMPFVYGTCRFVSGLTGVRMAESHTGPISDMD